MDRANAGLVCSISPTLESNAASASTSTSSSPIKSGKRSQSTFSNHVAIPVKKRSRLMGRPKNNWTATRKRKLVRLYLMTELGIEEIAGVLQAKDFLPCKRDIQKQLTSLLQSRPNQIRPRGQVTKAQVKMLRDCKSERASKKTQAGADGGCEFGHSLTSFVTSPSPWNLYSVLSTDQDLHKMPYTLPEFPCFPYLGSDPPQRSVDGFDDTISGRNTEGVEVTELCQGPIVSLEIDGQNLGTQLGMPNQQVPLVEPTPETVTPVFESRTSSHGTSGKELDVPDNHSTVSDGGKSNRSVLSISSLRRRLHSKYSSSLLDDVQSLMGRLSVSSCSDVSSFSLHKPMRRSLPQFCTPFKPSQNFTLPGIFPRYCWDHISHNKLLCCDDIRLPCNRAPLFKLSKSKTHQLVSAEILLSIRTQTVRADDLGVVDSFGNSILHIAAAFGSAPKYLLSLILLGGNIHLLNNANQTFLHLVDVSDVANIGEFRELLEELTGSGFNFAQQDHNGQTAIHALTEASVPWKTLSSIVHSFQLHNIPIPKCRDHLGKSIADQLQEKGFRLFTPDAQDHSALPIVEDLPLLPLGSSGEIQIFPAWQQTLANGQLPDPIENLEYSHEYQMHADLLRIILRSGEDPLFEAVEGRNGLHCLAEVRLDLPLEVDENTTDSTRKLLVRRESYLDQLLSNGVCPNRYDKHGITPFMSFVIHNRAEEDDASTTTLLSQLWQAGANINSRNSEGETALHLAVKLGRRAATKFLLSHGANIHVRNYKGLGVLALGIIHSDRAAQDTVLYAQISLCICLVGSVGAVSTPTLLDEWVSPEFKGQVGCIPRSGLSPDG